MPRAVDVGSPPLEKIYRSVKTGFVVLCVVIGAACTTSKKPFEADEAKFKDINDEFEKVVQVENLPPAPDTSSPDKKPVKTPVKMPVKALPPVKKDKVPEIKKHEPDIEDAEGFTGRRPAVDPFRAGERVTLTVNYFNVTAGDVILAVNDFKMVNDRKAYNFVATIRSNKTFSMFYAIDNIAETFLDFESLLPQTLTYDAHESSRERQMRTFFDWEKLTATQWKKEVHKKKGESKKKVDWPLESFSQNILSSLYYLRVFTLVPGKKLAFRVADDGKNYTFTAEVLRREELQTDIGRLKTVVVKPEFTLPGSFKPSGENLIWLTDDDRKLIVRVEAKVKLGSLVGKLKAIEGPK